MPKLLKTQKGHPLFVDDENYQFDISTERESGGVIDDWDMV